MRFLLLFLALGAAQDCLVTGSPGLLDLRPGVATPILCHWVGIKLLLKFIAIGCTN